MSVDSDDVGLEDDELDLDTDVDVDQLTDDEIDGISRRQVMQRAGAAGLAIGASAAGADVAGIGPTDRAEAVAPIVAGTNVAAGYAGYKIASGAAGYLDGLFSGSADEDEILEALADERHDQTYREAKQMEHDALLTLQGVQNQATMFGAYMRYNAAYDAVNEMYDRDDEDRSTVEDDGLQAAKDAIADAAAEIERNHYRQWRRHILDTAIAYTAADIEPELNIDDVFREHSGADGWETVFNSSVFDTLDLEGYEEDDDDDLRDDAPWHGEEENAAWDFSHLHPIPLINGEEQSLMPIGGQSEWQQIPWAVHDPDPDDIWVSQSNSDATASDVELDRPWEEVWDFGESHDSGPIETRFGAVHRTEGTFATFYDCREWAKAHATILETYEDEVGYFEAVIDELYDEIVAGNVEPGDIANPDEVLEAAGEFEDWNRAAAIYRAMAQHESEPAIFEIGDDLEVEGVMFWSSDDAEDGIPVGEEQTIDELPGSINIAAEVIDPPEDAPDDSEGDILVGEIGEDFEVLELLHGGDTLDFEIREIASADEEDVQDLIGGVIRAEDLRQESQKEVTEIIVEGDDGTDWLDWLTSDWLGIGLPNWVYGAGVGIGAFILWDRD